MKCKKCDFQLTVVDKFCTNCGAPVDEKFEDNVEVEERSVRFDQGNDKVTAGVSKKKRGGFLIGIIVGIVIIGVLVVVAVPTLLYMKYNNSNSVTSVSDMPYKVSLESFTFEIPGNIAYEKLDDRLLLGDIDGTWYVELMIVDGGFVQVKKNMSTFQSYFQKSGFVAKPAELKSIDGYEFVTIELEQSGTKLIGAFAKLNSMKTAWLVTYNQDNDYDYSSFKAMAPILSKASYEEASNSISESSDIDFNKNEISELTQ